MMAEITGEEQPAGAPVGDVINLNLLNKYELGKLIGRGAFAKVYLARDLRTGQSVAIKSVNKHRILKGHLAAQIKREIVIMRRLRHCRIVRLHEVLATKTKIYFVMELAKGGELFAKISKGRFTEDLSRKYFQQLIVAVDYCHSHGVFHRDLKPENLLLDEDWNLKISDFGLSALTDQIRPDGLLHTLCGTPAYVAPEFLAKKGYDGAKTDVWSCGVILFLLNSGYLPFNDISLMAMYRKIHKGEFRCPKWTSPDLKRLLTRLLDPNPITRITVNEILKHPWFNKGNSLEITINTELELNKVCGENSYLNAFDLISYSSGADLSGLFSSSGFSREMFMSRDGREKMVERIEALASADDGIVVAKAADGLVQLWWCGKLVVTVEVKRLNEEMVVVVAGVVKTAELGGAATFWEEKCKPQLVSRH